MHAFLHGESVQDFKDEHEPTQDRLAHMNAAAKLLGIKPGQENKAGEPVVFKALPESKMGSCKFLDLMASLQKSYAEPLYLNGNLIKGDFYTHDKTKRKFKEDAGRRRGGVGPYESPSEEDDDDEQTEKSISLYVSI